MFKFRNLRMHVIIHCKNQTEMNITVQYGNNVSVEVVGVEGKVERMSTEFKAKSNSFLYNSYSSNALSVWSIVFWRSSSTVQLMVQFSAVTQFSPVRLYEKGEWPEDFTETVLIPIPKKNNARKCKEFRIISLISHSAKIFLRVLNRHLYSKMEEQLEEEQFGFRKRKGTRDAIGLLWTIGEKYLEKNKEVYVPFVDLAMAFDRVDSNKLMRILKKIGVDWKERRLFSNLYMKQRVKVRIGEEMSKGSEIGRGVRQGFPLSPTLFNIYFEDLVKDRTWEE
ncbi:hypothetical protein ANN_06758 [Periplaneta americana]|uniref:Reverse transcriptase domain-containing protein n=1 Tax=Periplaneta americana TaxID=6978 RepID=A0ABQ8TF20_PERAM|nr:hypothetical protein ANN_06758 [Periplaneta americana]